MRLFVSVNLSSAVENYLLSVQRELNQNYAKLTLPLGLHLTLKFLGEIGDNELPEVSLALKAVKFNRFKANLDNVGIFPNEYETRIIWVGAEPKHEFDELFRKIDSKLSKFVRNDREFRPHITLARVKFVKDRQGLLSILKNLKIEKKEFGVDAFYLMKSTLTPEGPVYEVVEQFKAVDD